MTYRDTLDTSLREMLRAPGRHGLYRNLTQPLEPFREHFDHFGILKSSFSSIAFSKSLRSPPFCRNFLSTLSLKIVPFKVLPLKAQTREVLSGKLYVSCNILLR